jgi:hypothetical protein
MKLNHIQSIALDNLIKALQQATDHGVLDELVPWCESPDSINDVCDACDDLKEAQK